MVAVIAGGETRNETIMRAIDHIESEEALDEKTILVTHDAARPFVSVGTLENCLQACEVHDGAMPVLPMKDTVYLSESGGTVTALLEREKIFAGQAPEAFVLGKYLAGHCCRSGSLRSRDRRSLRYWRGWISR